VTEDKTPTITKEPALDTKQENKKGKKKIENKSIMKNENVSKPKSNDKESIKKKETTLKEGDPKKIVLDYMIQVSFFEIKFLIAKQTIFSYKYI
jgi:hypothetical protein